MSHDAMQCLRAAVQDVPHSQDIGRVAAVEGNILRATGLNAVARVGDRVVLTRPEMQNLLGEIVQIHAEDISILPEFSPVGVRIGAPIVLNGAGEIAPSDGWIGRIIDPDGNPLDDKPLLRGQNLRRPQGSPPPAVKRRKLGARIRTGLAVFNTLLPIVRGQRIGLFSGSGVGKSSLLGQLARTMQADVVVLALIGERGRELQSFVTDVLGTEGMQKSVIVAATSDQSPILRRRCALSAMTVAEHFRDQGKHVLFLADSITRFAEAHREVASAAGEPPSLRGFPASTSHAIMSLCERAGPGAAGTGDITGVFSVLVAGSDMEEPIADIMRGVLDGHVVLDRDIAQRGRFPAIDLLQSVSRALPAAATEPENQIINQARRYLGLFNRSETMIQAGLYVPGNDHDLDLAVKAWPELDQFIGTTENGTIDDSFKKLDLIFRRLGRDKGNLPANTPN